MGNTNTGRKIYQRLEQYSVATGIATGVVKANIPSDPDYIPPVVDHTTCPPPDPISFEDLTRVSMRIVNRTTQSIAVENLLVQITQDSSPFYNQLYSKGPGQEMFIDFRVQSSDSVGLVFTKIKKMSFTTEYAEKTGYILKHKVKVYWNTFNTHTSTSSSSVLFESNEFLLSDQISINTQSLPIPFQQLYQFNEIVIEFLEERVDITTTTTIKPTTTTTTKPTTTTTTSTTTTRNPNTNALVYNIRKNAGSLIKSITLVKQDGSSSVIGNDLPISSDVKKIIIPRGLYTVLIELTGTAGGSIKVSDNFSAEVSQSYLGDDGSSNPQGVYVFNNVNADEGLIVTYDDSTSAQEVIYARLEQEGSSKTESTAVLPYGKIERVMQSRYVRFYQDYGCTVPAPIKTTAIKYRQVVTGTSSATDDIELGFPLDSTQVEMSSINQYRQWDYTLNNPNAEEVNDLVEDLTYNYSLLPGFGYIVVE